MTEYILLTVSLITLAALIVAIRKIRLLHIASYELVDKVRTLSVESRHLYGQIQAYIDLKALLKFDKPLPTLRGWAASPDFLLTIAKHALSASPVNVLECSSGASTVVLARCMQLNGKGHVYSLENDGKFAKITRDNLAYHGLEDWATVIDAPLEPVDSLAGYNWYSLSGLQLSENIDMVVVDGPPWTTNQMARYPSIPMLKGKLSRSASIFLDDADRSDERKIIQKWCRENADLSMEHLGLEKGAVMLTRQPAA